MKYSVLMSVYQKDDPVFLKLALESIYDGQTRKPDEIVVVFDGPLTEEQYAVLEEFKCGKETVVFYFPQEENKGLGEALRIGSIHCTGDYIFRMDSDDICHERRFEKQISYLEAHPEVDAVGCDIAEFNQFPEDAMRVRACPGTHEEIVRMSRHRSPMNHMTVCIKRSALEKSGGYKALLLVEDYYLWVRMIATGCKLANIHETLLFARIGNGFYSRRSSKARVRGWLTIQSFMLKHKMVGVLTAVVNMVCIVGFTYCPNQVRKFAYNKFLRKQEGYNSGEVETQIPAGEF